MGQEYPAMIVQLAAVLAGDVECQFLPVEKKWGVVKALISMFRLHLWIGQESLVRSHFDDDGLFDQAVRRYVGFGGGGEVGTWRT